MHGHIASSYIYAAAGYSTMGLEINLVSRGVFKMSFLICGRKMYLVQMHKSQGLLLNTYDIPDSHCEMLPETIRFRLDDEMALMFD